MQYSQDKLDLLKEFTKFLNSPDQIAWRIQGGAGCGKTLFIRLLIEHYLAVNQLKTIIDPTTEKATSDNIFLTATTNKATAVLIEDVAEPLETKYGVLTCKTIFSLLGLKVYDDYKTGATKVTRPKNENRPLFRKNSLIIIDEASYVDWGLWKYIQKDLLDLGLKVIFIADFYQSTPVNCNMSPVFDPSIPYSTLTERHRYPVGSAIHTNSLLCERAIDTGKGGKITFDDSLERVRAKDVPALIQKHFVDEPSNTKIVAYHNKTVVGYNNQIAQVLYGNTDFNVGQSVIFNGFYVIGRRSIANEASGVIKRIGKSYYLNSFPDLEVREIIVTLHGNHDVSVVIPTDYFYFHQKLKDLAKAKEWRDYYTLKENVVDIRHPWACTAHKSQGSTYDFTIVDFNDLKHIKVLSDFYRMFNVSITRSRLKTYVIKD